MKSIASTCVALSMLWLASPVFATQTNAVVINTKSAQEQRAADSKIIAIVIAVDKSEMAAAAVAETKNIRAPVLEYAKYLQQQHQENLTQIDTLSKSTGLNPLQSTTSIAIATQNKKDLKILNALNDAPFESAYIDAMVKSHSEGLQLIANDLLKNVTNPELKVFLIDFRTLVEQHLEKGLKLQIQLKNQQS